MTSENLAHWHVPFGARALLVERATEDEGGHVQIDEHVFTVAFDEE
ncbi:hypothetical protein [Streptomyces sp. NPDC059466]